MPLTRRVRNALLSFWDLILDLPQLFRRRPRRRGVEAAVPPPPVAPELSPTAAPTAAAPTAPAPPATVPEPPPAPTEAATEVLPGASRMEQLRRLVPKRKPRAPRPPSPPPVPGAPGPLKRAGESLREWARRLPAWTGLVAGILGAAIIALIVLDPFGGDEVSSPALTAPADVKDSGEQAEASASLGFPAFATKTTTRIGSADAATVAAGASVAVFPGVEQRPEAVALVPDGNWQAGIAASVLMAPPVRAPLLYSGPDEVPSATSAALKLLQPAGGDPADGKQGFAIAGAKVPDGLRTAEVGGSDAAAVADGIDKLRATLASAPEPEHMVIVSQEDPDYAMPAAAWAARSGDPVFFTGRTSVPAPTAAALGRHKGVPAYVLGPETAVSPTAFKALQKLAPSVKRVSGPDPVANAIAFARFQDGTFGWNINDPGHGMVIANSTRPLDAGAAAPLSAAGKYGPLLLVDTPDRLPEALRAYLLDIKPGYDTDPTRAFYNHAWLIGDVNAISLRVQGQLDALLELAPIGQATAPTQVPTPPTPPTPPAAGSSKQKTD